MAEMDAAVVETVPEKRSRKKLVLVLVAVVVLAGAAAAVLLTGMVGASAEEPEVAAVEAPTEGAVVPLESMTASIGGAAPGYVRIGIALVLAEGITPDAVADRFPLIQDAALSELSHFEPKVLRTPEGIADLREVLGARAREIYPDGEVMRVVFTELLVQ